jgi:hypothetical protein
LPRRPGSLLRVEGQDAVDHELRFLVERDEVQSILARLAGRLRRDVFDPGRPIAYARTTYLDTETLDYYRRDAGALQRRIRVREYADAAGLEEPARLTGLCALELKENHGTRRRKIRFVAPPEAIGRMLSRGEPTPGCPAEILSILDADRLAPRMTTWYRRLSFTDARQRVRLTIDADLSFCQPTLPGAAGEAAEPLAVLATFPRYILEAKCTGYPPRWLLEALAAMPPARSFSKFRAGMLAVAEDAPSHAMVAHG